MEDPENQPPIMEEENQPLMEANPPASFGIQEFQDYVVNFIQYLTNQVANLGNYFCAADIAVGLCALASIALSVYAFRAKHNICVRTPDRKCLTAVYVMTFLAVLVVPASYIVVRVWIWVKERSIGWIEKVPSWFIAVFLGFGLILSYLISMLGLASVVFSLQVECCGIIFWCLEHRLGRKHWLGLSSTCISLGTSMAFNMMQAEGLKKLEVWVIIDMVVVVVIDTYLIYLSQVPGVQLRLAVLNDVNATPIIPQVLILQAHTNEGNDSKFQLKSIESPQINESLYELVPDPTHQANFKLYDILPI